MKLFSYYALHSIKNQLKKLFKTWILFFFIVCIVIGGLVGFGAAMLEDMSEDDNVAQEIEVIEQKDTSLLDKFGLDAMDLIELIAGGIILAVFVFTAISADKNGSKIFLPADINLLFASPMRPQSVLMFRLMTQLGTAIMASIYLLFQIPNLTLNLGMSIWATLAVIAVWCFTIIIGTLLQLLLYTVSSTNPKVKGYLRTSVYIILALIVTAYIIFWKQSGVGYLNAAVLFFNAKVSRYIPFWGWLKGFCIFAMEGNLLGFVLCLTAIVIGSGILTYIIWHIKADFYEDAMAKSEETAELLNRIQSEKATGIIFSKRKKDRSDSLKRDGMRHGIGANMFFFKTLYNRFRFAHFGIFTKTMETYLVAAIIVCVFCRFIIQTTSLIPVALTLAGLSFFRSLGNPLEQDTKMDYFVLIPENTWAKLFWSLLGGTVNCLLDVLPAMILAAILLGVSPLPALAWILFIVSVDFYATNVGTFINLSVPVSAGKLVKQIVQIMFIYFGLLPDIFIIAIGLILKHTATAVICTAVLNMGLGFLFFGLSPLFLGPKGGKPLKPVIPFTGDLKLAKSQFSRLGMGTFIILAVASVLQVAIIAILNMVYPEWGWQPWLMWLCTFAPLYLIAVPLGFLVIRKAPATPPEKHSLKAGQYIVIAIICIFMMYAGNILGIVITSLLHSALGLSAINPITPYAMDTSPLLKLLFLVILAPIIEEFIFRKQLIDRMNIYGEKLAVVTSAVMFGLFHGNLSQLFYAVGLGLVFGYVYLKTGKLSYCIGLHMFINLLGSIVGPALLENANFLALETADIANLDVLQSLITPGLIGFIAYTFALIGLAVTGFVLLCVKSRHISFKSAEFELPRGNRFKTVYLNIGMLLLISGTVVMIIASIVS